MNYSFLWCGLIRRKPKWLFPYFLVLFYFTSNNYIYRYVRKCTRQFVSRLQTNALKYQCYIITVVSEEIKRRNKYSTLVTVDKFVTFLTILLLSFPLVLQVVPPLPFSGLQETLRTPWGLSLSQPEL